MAVGPEGELSLYGDELSFFRVCGDEIVAFGKRAAVYDENVAGRMVAPFECLAADDDSKNRAFGGSGDGDGIVDVG